MITSSILENIEYNIMKQGLGLGKTEAAKLKLHLLKIYTMLSRKSMPSSSIPSPPLPPPPPPQPLFHLIYNEYTLGTIYKTCHVIWLTK